MPRGYNFHLSGETPLGDSAIKENRIMQLDNQEIQQTSYIHFSLQIECKTSYEKNNSTIK